MIDPGSHPSRSGLLRALLLAAAGLGVLGVAGWLALQASAPPPAPTRAAVPAAATTPAPAPAVATQTGPAPAPAPPVPPRTAAAGQPGPTAPTTASAGPQKPSFDIVRVSPRGDTVVAGRAAPGAEVTLEENGHAIGHAKADAGGQFVILPAKPLGPGGRELTLSSRDAKGQQTAGAAPVVVAMPAAPATSPGTGPQTGEASAQGQTQTPPRALPLVMLTVPGATPRVLQGPGAGHGPAARVALNVVDYDPHGEIRFGGRGPVGAVVRVYIDNLPVGEAVVDSKGDWTLVPGRAVAPGTHSLRLDQLGANGKVVAREELPFQRADLSAPAGPGAPTPDSPAGAAPPGTAPPGAAVQVVVQPKQSLWRIARTVYGHGIRYTVIYEANQAHIRDPNLIYPGQVFRIPAAATPDSSSNSK